MAPGRNKRASVSRNGNNKNLVSNVRIVDKDEGTDDVVCQRILQHLKTSESQIRVSCNYRLDLTVGAASTGSIDFVDCINTTDDFASFNAQFREFRIRAIRVDVYDINPALTAVNYWSTFHVVNDANPPVGLEDVIDRPDSRSISPGTGHISLAWVAHGIPEMSFNSVDAAVNYGGIAYYNALQGSTGGAKYSIIAKFIVDFRGRR